MPQYLGRRHGVDSPSPCRRVRRGHAAADRRGAAARRRPLGRGARATVAAGGRSPRLVTLPILWLGYGTDLDIGAVLDAGAPHPRPRLRPLAQPGRAGGRGHRGRRSTRSAATCWSTWPRRRRSAATVVGIARLVRAWGHDNGDLVALAFLASPIVLDLGHPDGRLRLGGGVPRAGVRWLLVRGQPGRRRACCWRWRSAAAARRCCSSAALLVAVGWDRAERRRVASPRWRWPLPLAVLLYVPVWLSYDRTLRLPRRHRRLGRPGEQPGPVRCSRTTRWPACAGGAAGGGGAAGAGAVAAAVGRATRMVRFACWRWSPPRLLFLRMPWKPAHLCRACWPSCCGSPPATATGGRSCGCWWGDGAQRPGDVPARSSPTRPTRPGAATSSRRSLGLAGQRHPLPGPVHARPAPARLGRVGLHARAHARAGPAARRPASWSHEPPRCSPADLTAASAGRGFGGRGGSTSASTSSVWARPGNMTS